MLKNLRHLFWHHHSNNHKPKILHLSSLTFLTMLVVASQALLTIFSQAKPGVLGFASHITAEEIVAYTNRQRTSLGLPGLKINSSLNQAAEAKARYMFDHDFWAHNAPDGTTPWFFFKQAGYSYRYAGENLARDFADSPSVVTAWMNSPTHKDNVVSENYNEIGVAVVDGVLNGEETTLVVQLFGRPAEAVAEVSQEAAQAGAETIIKTPEISLAEQEGSLAQSLSWPKTVLGKAGEKYSVNLPLFSSFNLTKSVNLAVIILIMAVLAIDGWLVWRRQTARISGKSFLHFSFFALVALIIILSGSGRIL